MHNVYFIFPYSAESFYFKSRGQFQGVIQDLLSMDKQVWNACDIVVMLGG